MLQSRAGKLLCSAIAGQSCDIRSLCVADWREFARFATTNWQIQPLLYDWLLSQSDLYSECRAALPNFPDDYLAVQTFSIVQLQCLDELNRAFARSGIPYCLLKSSATRLIYYSNPVHRTGWDFDVAVEKTALPAARKLVEGLAYCAAQWNPTTRQFSTADPRLRARVEAEHYELGFYARRNRVFGLDPQLSSTLQRQIDSSRHWHQTNGDLCCYSTVDIHHGLSLEITTNDVIANARCLKWRTTDVMVPSDSWMCFHLIYKLYWEGVHNYGKGLYQFADLCRAISKLTSDGIEDLIRMLDVRNLRAAMYFVLRRLPSEFKITLPARLESFALTECSRPRLDDNPISSNDLGDMWKKLWGLR